jgi:hypothetical protein
MKPRQPERHRFELYFHAPSDDPDKVPNPAEPFWKMRVPLSDLRVGQMGR